MLPDGWDVKFFGEVCSIASGQVDPTISPYKEMRHLGPDNIESDTGVISSSISAEELGLISGKYLFDENSIVYSKIRPNLNKVCLPNFKGLCSADMYPLWPTERTDKDYLFQLIRSPSFLRQAVACSMRTGLPKINRNDLCRIKIHLAPQAEQFQIARLLSLWDGIILSTTKQIAQKKEQKKALTQRLLTGKQRFPAFSNQEWRKVKANKLFKSISKKKNGDAPLLAVMQDIGVVPRDMLDRKVAMPEGSTEGYKLIEPGNFVISLRSFQGGLEYSRYMGLVSPAYTVLESTKEMDDDFYRHYFKSYDFIGHLAVAVIGIRDGKQISYEDFSFLELPFPSLNEQKKIASALNAADHEVELLAQKLKALKEQKKGLMQQLLTGKKRMNINKKEAV